ncbi:hypothetical protein BI343_08530 [Chromobacterium amazonense]|nr:hypothetical protein BI343_08530 [Chromobacterium amazonense]
MLSAVRLILPIVRDGEGLPARHLVSGLPRTDWRFGACPAILPAFANKIFYSQAAISKRACLGSARMRRQLWLAVLWSLALPVPAQTLLVAMEEADNRPFEYLDDQGNLTGFHTEIVRAVAKALGWEVSFLRMPWGRAQLSLANGKVDAVTYMGKTAERMKYAVFLDGNQLDVERVTLFVRREDVICPR